MKQVGEDNPLIPNGNIPTTLFRFGVLLAFVITEVTVHCDLFKPLFPSVVAMMKMLHHYQQNLLISTH